MNKSIVFGIAAAISVFQACAQKNPTTLNFEPQHDRAAQMGQLDTIILGGGCFWCIEAIFQDLNGVKSVVSGYGGGQKLNPTYKEVCSGQTGHAEVVQIVYDNHVLPLSELLNVFFNLHDPTTRNRQGADVGTQYRSVIFYYNAHQKAVAANVLETLQNERAFDQPIVTELAAFSNFYPAENYHQDYYELNKENPYCRAVILPKMDKLNTIFAQKLKKIEKTN